MLKYYFNYRGTYSLYLKKGEVLVVNIPEWEVEDAIAWRPELLDDPPTIRDIKLVQRQKYLPTLGRYIDLLFRSHDKFILVEVKATNINDDRVIYNQILPYRDALVQRYRIPPNQIIPVLALVGEVSDALKKNFEENGIIIKQINAEDIIKTKPPRKKILGECHELQKIQDILKRRGIIIDKNEIKKKITIFPESRSVQTWINDGVHDYLAKEHVASILKEISSSSPIMAHEIETDNNGKMIDFIDMWFWLFYSVLDRRSNASNFIRAKESLEKENLFHPKQLNDIVKIKGETKTLNLIAEILRKNNFPLLVDRSYKDLANPKSIIDGARLIEKYDYNFDKLYKVHFKKYKGEPKKAFQSIWKEIKYNIYGVGDRITAQFIRGMVLKGSWDISLSNDKFLEKCGFNETFAGPLRLNLVENEYYLQDLGGFADEYLEGNRGIISHALWYIRRKYCHRRPD
ncbi:MAG: hypothetical protein ACOC5T_06065, partial [Elusimicrobiota bacterium]